MPDTTDYRTVNRQLKAGFNFKIIGKHMQSVRKRRGMTQSEVAEEMKLGTKYYASMESGAVKISLPRFLQFIIIMQTSADYLLSGCHPEYPPQLASCEGVCKERIILNKLLDQCPDEMIRTLNIIVQGLIAASNS